MSSVLQLANENPLGIKIKEITKPEEIRITDDKPKAFKPTKSTTTTTTTQSSDIDEVSKLQTDATTTVTTESTTQTTTDSPTSTTPRIEDTNQSVNSMERESHDYMDDGVTVDDKLPGAVAPSTKSAVDGEVEPELLLVGADSNSIGDESSNKSVRQTVENR